jgi:transketolase
MAKQDKSIFVLTGDLGFSVFENFISNFKDRFINVGVAEQNMIGVAAGLAFAGKTAIAYSIVPFAVIRCLEQIRNDVCFQDMNIKIIGVGAGLQYGSAGSTHYGIEDMAVVRALPNIKILSPACAEEAKLAMRAALSERGPFYIRLGKSLDDGKYLEHCKFKIGKGMIIESGKDLTIICTGSILSEAISAVKLLKNIGISAQLVNMHTIRPFDKDMILQSLKETGNIFSVEEHRINGGLGSEVAEVLSEAGSSAKLTRIALPDTLIKTVGSRDYLLEHYSMSAKGIVKTIMERLKPIK